MFHRFSFDGWKGGKQMYIGKICMYRFFTWLTYYVVVVDFFIISAYNIVI